ncbi:uncharacterized protein LOC111392455 [Olea europaea var. sylvestris]|uniref:uncharacterized protein LOC111392455 n=1 Tax=Olea europaea var. sylvestris TaxID=158386 RepID=UPI000C1D1AF8|nr:uncharacterized protein LOC111392455 [Olea europaea var. sylvestris]
MASDDNTASGTPPSITIPENGPSSSMAMTLAKPFPDVSKIEVFADENFKRWQERLYSLLDIHGVAFALKDPKPSSNSEAHIQDAWVHAKKVCRYTILQTLSNELFDVYCSYKEAKTIWEALVKKFNVQDTTKQKFVVLKFYRWEMIDNKDIKDQITEYQKLLEELKAEEIELPKKFVAGILIEKLPKLWNDYKNNLKHKHKLLSMDELITHILIEDTN